MRSPALALSDQAWADCWQHATDHMANVERWGRKATFPDVWGVTPFDRAFDGYAAELIAESITGLHVNWIALPERYRLGRKPPDIGTRTQVRSTRYEPPYLKLNMSDRGNRDHYFLLMVGQAPLFSACGWIRGSDAMVDRYWGKPRDVPAWGDRYPAWWVPESDLSELPLPTDA